MNDLRVKMVASEAVGGPGHQARDMIPIIVDDAVVHDVFCYVPDTPPHVGKERAVRIVTLLNDGPGGVGLNPALSTRAAPGTAAAAGPEAAGRLEALAVVVRAAVAKLHDLIMERGTALNPYNALKQLEDGLRSAGLPVPERPAGWENKYARYRSAGDLTAPAADVLIRYVSLPGQPDFEDRRAWPSPLGIGGRKDRNVGEAVRKDDDRAVGVMDATNKP